MREIGPLARLTIDGLLDCIKANRSRWIVGRTLLPNFSTFLHRKDDFPREDSCRIHVDDKPVPVRRGTNRRSGFSDLGGVWSNNIFSDLCPLFGGKRLFSGARSDGCRRAIHGCDPSHEEQ